MIKMILITVILRSEDEGDGVHCPSDLTEPVTRQVQSFWRVGPDVILGVGELTSLGPLGQCGRISISIILISSLSSPLSSSLSSSSPWTSHAGRCCGWAQSPGAAWVPVWQRSVRPVTGLSYWPQSSYWPQLLASVTGLSPATDISPVTGLRLVTGLTSSTGLITPSNLNPVTGLHYIPLLLASGTGRIYWA